MAYDRNQFQLTHLLQAVYNALNQTKGLKATGGSQNTILDTTISTDQQEDSFLGQYAFVTYDAGGSGAAPEGEYARCTAYAADTFTLSFAASAFSAAIAAGDRITMVKNTLYPVYDVIRICNDALRSLGRYPIVDTSLATAANTTEYTLPLATKGREIINVEYQGRTGVSGDNDRTAVYWRRAPAAPGATETMILPQLGVGRTIYITYLAEHPILENYYDAVSEYVPRGLAIAICALRVAEWKRNASKEILPALQQSYASELSLNPLERYVRRIVGMPHTTTRTRYPGDRNA